MGVAARPTARTQGPDTRGYGVAVCWWRVTLPKPPQLQRDAQRRIAEERLQIAGDVHDLLAHTIWSMTVQAGVAADAIDRDGETPRAGLANTRHAGRTAMQELRVTVSLLRSAGEAGATAPAPRLVRISELVEFTRGHGFAVDRPQPSDHDALG